MSQYGLNLQWAEFAPNWQNTDLSPRHNFPSVFVGGFLRQPDEYDDVYDVTVTMLDFLVIVGGSGVAYNRADLLGTTVRGGVGVT